MNTLHQQSSETLPDFHWHICDVCNISFDHYKSKIPKGRSAQAHRCPECARPCNRRFEFVPCGEVISQVDYPAWYGPEWSGKPADSEGGLP